MKKKKLICLKAAADSGNGKALIMYSKSLYRKIEEVAHCMKLAVDKTDDVEMIRFYARLLHDGLGVEANKEDIAHYFEIATMRNDPQSCFQLAEILYNGNGVDVNKQKAAEFYKSAADNCYTDAMKRYE